MNPSTGFIEFNDVASVQCDVGYTFNDPLVTSMTCLGDRSVDQIPECVGKYRWLAYLAILCPLQGSALSSQTGISLHHFLNFKEKFYPEFLDFLYVLYILTQKGEKSVCFGGVRVGEGGGAVSHTSPSRLILGFQKYFSHIRTFRG